jgi:hypothetical protein
MPELPFMDSFDHWGPLHSTRKWTFGGTNASTPGRNGNGWKVGTFSILRFVTGGGYNKLCAGAAYNSPAFANRWISFENAFTGEAIGLGHVGDGRLIIQGRKTSTGDVNYSQPSTLVIHQNEWYYLEFKASIITAVINNQTKSVGYNYTARVNEEVIFDHFITGLPPIDYQGFSELVLFGPGGGHQATIDDVYLNDTDFWGDVEIGVIRPDGPGNYAEWTPVGASHNWDTANDIVPDDETTKVVATSAMINKRDMYNMENISVIGEIKGIHALICAKKSDSGSAACQAMYNINNTELLGFQFYPSESSYLYFREGFEFNPVTGQRFTESEINNMQFGFKRIL